MTSKLSVPQSQIDELKRVRQERLEQLMSRAREIRIEPLPRGQAYKSIAVSVDASRVPIQTDVVDGVVLRCTDSDGTEYYQGLAITDAPNHAIQTFMDDLFAKTPALNTLLQVMNAPSWKSLMDFEAKNTDLDRFIMELLEWGSLVMLAQQSTRTILFKDGLLRSKAFNPRKEYPDNLRDFFKDSCEKKGNFLIGIAKESAVLEKSKVLLQYVKGFNHHRGFYLEIPEDILKDTYGWRYLAQDVIWGKLYFVRLQPHTYGRVMTVEVPNFLESQLDQILRTLADFKLRNLPERFRGLPDPIAWAHENTNLIVNFGKAIQKEVMQ